MKLFIIAAAFAIFAAAPANAQVGDYNSSSGMQNSGEWANWSDWLSHCTPNLQPGYRITNWTYGLRGDRQCGSWAECEVIEDTDIRKCVRFKLQGHNEGGGNPITSPWMGNGNNGVRQSEMVISYRVVRVR